MVGLRSAARIDVTAVAARGMFRPSDCVTASGTFPGVLGFHDIELTRAADQDLRDVGGATERNLFGELLRLGDAERRGETRLLEWKDADAAVRRSWRIGNFAVVYRVRLDEVGRRIAVIEAVVLKRQLTDWLAARSVEAKLRDEAIAAERPSSGAGERTNP